MVRVTRLVMYYACKNPQKDWKKRVCACVFTDAMAASWCVHDPHSPVLLLRTTLEPLWGTMCFWLARHRLQGGRAAAAVCRPTDASDVARNWTSISANPPAGASFFPPRWQNPHTHLHVTVRPHLFPFKRALIWVFVRKVFLSELLSEPHYFSTLSRASCYSYQKYSLFFFDHDF